MFKARLNEITGITDPPAIDGASGNIKEVQFTFSYDGLPPIAKRFVKTHGTGVAILRKYDDGWRAEHVNLTSQADQLSQTELGEIEQDKRTETARQAGLAEIQNRKMAERTAALNALITESRIPTRELGTLETIRLGATGAVAQVATLKLTDVNVTFQPEDIPLGPPITVWFGCLWNIETSPGTLEPGVKGIYHVVSFTFFNREMGCPTIPMKVNTRDEQHRQQVYSELNVALNSLEV